MGPLPPHLPEDSPISLLLALPSVCLRSWQPVSSLHTQTILVHKDCCDDQHAEDPALP